jgi:hypothetical protein
VSTALGTRDEHAQLRRLRQVAGANQFNKEMSADVGKASARVAELARAEVAQPTFSPVGEEALLGIEKPSSATSGEGTSGGASSSSGARLASSAPLIGARPKMVARSASHDANSNKITRRLSVQSEDAMNQLAELDVQLRSIEQQVAQISSRSLEAASPESVGQMRTALAQLEADANKLETKGVDNIYTSMLSSGQEYAKEAKKAQLRRLESLFALIESIFQRLK